MFGDPTAVEVVAFLKSGRLYEARALEFGFSLVVGSVLFRTGHYLVVRLAQLYQLEAKLLAPTFHERLPDPLFVSREAISG